MPRAIRLLSSAALLIVLSATAPRAAEVRVVSSDAQGVTLQLDVAGYQLEAATADGRVLPLISGLANGGDTGRPRLPFGRALLALPPGARAVARVVASGGDATQENVRVAIYPRHGSQRDERLGAIPTLEPAEPILDGAWPRELVAVGEPAGVRERSLVPVFLYPLRYDEITARLTLTRSITVRVDFVGGVVRTGLADDPDPRHDPVFASRVLNWDQARTWRERRPVTRESVVGRGALTGPAAQAPRSGPALAAFEEDAPEVRVRIDSTGVYAIGYDSLAIYGYPAAVPIGEVSVHRHEFVQDAVTPYVTYELAREVEDNNSNNVFDAGDRIVLWVWSWASRARATNPQRNWGDAEVIFVTRKPGAAGLAFAHRTGWLGLTGMTPLNSYPLKQRYRKITQYVAFPQDTTMDQFLWTNYALFTPPEVLPYETNDIDGAKPETLTVNMQGTGNTQHITWATTRNAQNVTTPVVTAAVWSGLRFDSRTVALAPGVVSEGATNQLRVWGQTNSGSGSAITFAGVHSFDLTYWRSYVPISGYLNCNSGTETSTYEILAGPFTSQSQLRVFDVSDSLNPVRLDDVHVEFSDPDVFARFQDTAAPGVQRDYVVCDVPRTLEGGAISRVTRHEIWKNTVGDYLAIVPEGFQSTILPLVDLHSRQGLRVVVAPLEGINDEFNGGRKSSHAIKRFIRYAYNRWNAQFVLLVGDGTEDPLHRILYSGPDFMPVHKAFGPVSSATTNGDVLKEMIPCDTWYGLDLNGTGSVLARPYADLAIGRLPVNSVSQLAGVVDKIVRYDNLAGDQTWRHNVMLMADDAYSGLSTFDGSGSENTYCRKSLEENFARIDVVSDSLIRKLGGLSQTNVELFNMSYYLPNLGLPGPPPDFEYTTSGGADTCRNQRNTFRTRGRLIAFPALASRINAGQMLWTYQGHANPWVMSHEDIYLNSGANDDKDRLMNDGKPFIFMGFSCHPNAFARVDAALFDLGPAFGEELSVLGNNRGAVASYASAGYEAIPVNFNKQLQIYLINAMFVNPPRDELLGDRGARGVLGEIVLAGLVDNYDGRIGNQSEQFVGISYQLLGDPATRVSLGPPQSVVTANSVPVVSGQDIRLHTPGDTLRLDADLVSNVRLDSLVLTRTGAAGTTVIWRSPAPPPAGLTVTPAFPDTAAATSVFGGRRFHLTYKDQLIADSFRYTFRTVDRYGLVATIDAVFAFRTFLQLNGQALLDGDVVTPAAALSMVVRSPKPINPETDLTLRIDNAIVDFTATAAGSDVSGREWILDWTHAPYIAGSHDARLTSTDGGLQIMTFRVAEIGTAVQLRNVLAFPNPFDDDYLRALNPGFDTATLFSFDLVTAAPADVSLRVYTISGRLIYERTEHAMDSRYHQIGWNGRDSEGFPIANGVYLYRLLANNGSGTTMQEGRIVKLRRPRRIAAPSSSSSTP